MAEAQAGRTFTVDLDAITLQIAGAPPMAFIVHAEQRLALLNGWDETAIILNTHRDGIERFEVKQRAI